MSETCLILANEFELVRESDAIQASTEAKFYLNEKIFLW